MTLHLVKEGSYAATLLSQIEFDVLDCLACEETPVKFEQLRTEYETLSDYMIVQLDEALEKLIQDGMIACWLDKSLVVTKKGKKVITFAEETRI